MTDYIFITYDKGLESDANAIATILKDHGYNVWFDKNSERQNPDWWYKALRAVMGCRVFIAIENNKNTSQWVENLKKVAKRWHKQRVDKNLIQENASVPGQNKSENANTSLSILGQETQLFRQMRHEGAVGEDVTDNHIHLSFLGDIFVSYEYHLHPDGTTPRMKWLSRLETIILGIIITVVGGLILHGILNFSPPYFQLPQITIFGFYNPAPIEIPERCIENTAHPFMILYVKRANGARVYREPINRSQAITTYVYNQGIEDEYPNFIVAIAHLNSWFLIEHPNETGYYGWVLSDDVHYNNSELNCLPDYSPREFSRDDYPVWQAPIPQN